MIAHSCNPKRLLRFAPRCGDYTGSHGLESKCRCAALPFLRAWYNDCTFVQSEAVSPLRPAVYSFLCAWYIGWHKRGLKLSVNMEEMKMINKLVEKIRKTGAPIVVGLDPMLSYIPQHVQDKAFAEYGETLEGAAEAIWQFNKEIVDKTYDLIPAVKPQIAMYEQFGVPGVEAFKKTVDYCKSKDLVVIGDIKRGDIGSTSAAYAVGHLGKVKVGSKEYVPFDEDFATVNPYLGSDGVKPFIEVCKEEKKGLFILVKTSNPSSGEFQDRLIDGRPLYELVGEKVAEWGADCMGDGYSYIGAVVGATYPEMGKVLRKIMPKSYILVPGYGAQGGQGKDLVHFFNEDGLGAIVNSSRGIIAAYKQEAYSKFGAENFGDASRAAVEAMIADISGALAGK